MAESAHFYVYKDIKNEWRWRFIAKNAKIIAVSSESYLNLKDCEHSIELVKTQDSATRVIGDDSFMRLRTQ